jgi:hypothetical protein
VAAGPLAGRAPPHATDTEGASTAITKAAVANIAAATCGLLWALFLVFVTVWGAMGAFDSQFAAPDDPPVAFVVVSSGIWAAFCLVTTIAQAATAVFLLRPRRVTEAVAFVGAVIALCSLWTAFVYPATVVAGIYTLVILRKPDVQQFLRSM